jgi:hypothetical protein
MSVAFESEEVQKLRERLRKMPDSENRKSSVHYPLRRLPRFSGLTADCPFKMGLIL